jgi:CheY-like chemotaxis protein
LLAGERVEGETKDCIIKGFAIGFDRSKQIDIDRFALIEITEGPFMNETLGKNHETPDGLAEFDAFVLVVEDNPVNQEVAQLMLEMLGCRVDLAQNGVEAVDRAENELYDLILMDCQMPEMDGIEATRLIREKEKNGDNCRQRHITIIALSGDEVMLKSGDYLVAGMDDCLAKPYDIKQLCAVMGKWLPRVKSNIDLTE